MSGLKLTEDKTKAVWIDSMANSELKMCNDYNLDWDQNSIKILGVAFDPGIYNIWDLNSVELITKFEKLLLTWSKRKLTLSGKITVIKSLALSKFTHLFISLPNPPEALIKRLDRMFYKFYGTQGQAE